MPSLNDIAQALGGQVFGDPLLNFSQLKVPQAAGPQDLCICIDKKHSKDVRASKAGALVCDAHLDDPRPKIVVASPRAALPQLTALFNPYPGPQLSGIDPSAMVDASAIVASGVGIGPHAVVAARCRIGAQSQISAGVVLGRGVTMGEACLIYPNVVIYDGVQIGDRVILHAGCVLGSDGFGNHREGDGRWSKIPQIGACIIGDDVELGANTTVDRGAIGPTRIGRGTKIDNLCQVAHNVIIGEDCALASGVALAGSTVLGDRVMMGGQSGAIGHLSIGDDVIVMARAGVASDVPAKAVLSGFPARPHRQELAITARLRQLAKKVDGGLK